MIVHRTVHRSSFKIDRNFRTDNGGFEWAKLQAARRREGLDVPRLFFAIFEDAPIPTRLFEALGGVRLPLTPNL